MLKEQAKKMNVQSLSNKDASSESVEFRIAKAAFTIFFLFVCAWTPYAIVGLIGAFGDKTLLTPLVTMIPAVSAKIVSCLDPWVYAVRSSTDSNSFITVFFIVFSRYLTHVTVKFLKRKFHGSELGKNLATPTMTRNQSQLTQPPKLKRI